MALVQHDADLWSTELEIGWQGGLIPLLVRMTVLRLEGGRLVLHSPIPLSAGLRAELEALGEVEFIVVPQAHGKFAAPAAEASPEARLLAAPRASWRRKALPFDGSLADEAPAEWGDRVECLRVRFLGRQRVPDLERIRKLEQVGPQPRGCERNRSRSATPS